MLGFVAVIPLEMDHISTNGIAVVKSIVSDIPVDRLPAVSRNLTYQVLVPSAEVHQDQLVIFHDLLVAYGSVGLQIVPLHENCIDTTQLVSVADSVRVVDGLVTEISHPLIEMVQIGLVISTIKIPVSLLVQVFCNLSYAAILRKYTLSVNEVRVVVVEEVVPLREISEKLAQVEI